MLLLGFFIILFFFSNLYTRTDKKFIMIVKAMKSKIHRATVTQADLNYIGSISIDRSLMDAANLLPYEQVQVLNITNGNRLVTYIIKGKRGSGEVCINGAAAHLVSQGDLVIVAAYCSVSEDEAKNFQPTIVHVDNKNNVIK